MTFNIEGRSRQQIAEFLPDAIARSLTSYRVYMDSKDDKDPAAFKEMHSAGKTAIAHIELLLKLARWADLPDDKALSQNDRMVLEAVLAEAEDELAGHDGAE